MRHLHLAAIALLVLAPSVASAATATWQPATATGVVAGVNTNKTFVVQAYVSLPTQCDAARIRSSALSMHTTRHFFVEELPASSPCSQKAVYTCTVSESFPLPIPATFDVESKGKQWKVHLSQHEPSAMGPTCKKG